MTSLFRSKRQSMVKSSSSMPMALAIPEILECIFSFLTNRRRLTVVQFVSKQWHAVCRHMADPPPTTAWDFYLIEPQYSLFIASLSTSRVLNLFTKRSPFQDVTEWKDERWRKLLAVVDDLQAEGKIQLQEVHVGDELASIHFLEPLLPVLDRCSTSISILRLQLGERPDHTLLHLVLRVCANLQVLDIKTDRPMLMPPRDETVAALGAKKTESPLEALPVQSRLKTLEIAHLILIPDAVESIIDACASLRQLSIWQAYPAQFTKQDATLIIRRIASSCPLLKTFHFSIQGWCWTNADMAMFLDYQPPSLTGWSFSDKDIEMNLPSMALSPSIQSWPPQTPLCRTLQSTDSLLLTNHHQRLTFLELKRTPRNNGRDRIPDVQCAGALHQFLCNAPCLQHLLAPNVVIEIENLDIHNILRQERLRQNNITSQPRDSRDALPPLWACRGLRTLHVTFDHDQGIVYQGAAAASGKGKDISTLDSLIIFGYLSRCCPDLRDLQMRRWSTTVSMEAGFCLLSRLGRLEKLVLTGRHFDGFTKQDLGWILKESQGSTAKWLPGLSMLSAAATSGSRSRPQGGNQSTIGASEDLKMDLVGRIEDVHEWEREAKARSGGDRLCSWPGLEYLQFKWVDSHDGAVNKTRQEIVAFWRERWPAVEIVVEKMRFFEY
ncbi:hypothetical protein BG015_011361 [Linnemannia schmuckeri]|uniref:F-box domain-containing protein n=1 Tax=Linnemannia schmuckeri TaxID=64567 RepID=A0A9P5V883_9FUNG|nr:hypothetical protein BG015_011361 [Linnemannia schmuckeri]